MKQKGLKLGLAAILLLAGWTPGHADEKVKVVTSLPDLADITRQIGGDRVDVGEIAKGYQDPHFVDPKPSHVLKMTQAAMFVHIGLDLEVAWVPPLLEKARNKQIYFGGNGYVNAAEGIQLLEVPNIDPAQLRAKGDIHVFGNPHYWLDPLNGKIMARRICDRLSQLSPADAPYFAENLAAFEARLDSAMAAWTERFQPYVNRRIIAYHNSWPYFTKRFGIVVKGFVEPKPGIPPTPRHLVSIIKLMRSEGIRVIIISPYFDDKPAKTVADRTNARVVHFAPSVGAFDEVESYFDLFDYNLNLLISAFQSVDEELSGH
jgi:zinc/manganese transport system substrate-binding protein